MISCTQDIDLATVLRAALYCLTGGIVATVISHLIYKLTLKRLSAHHSMLFRRVSFYLIFIVFMMLTLREFGLDVSTLVGTSGVLTAAGLFAAQTTISNFLSGVFLVAEQPFIIGDVIEINDALGEIISIDPLSVKIKTKDNTMIRIPNELLLKSQFKNVSRFPIRRLDLTIHVSFQEDLPAFKTLLLAVAHKNEICLKAPAPEFIFLEFGQSALLLKFCVWTTHASFTALQTSLQMEIQAALKAHHITLPVLPRAL